MGIFFFSTRLILDDLDVHIKWYDLMVQGAQSRICMYNRHRNINAVGWALQKDILLFQFFYCVLKLSASEKIYNLL